MTFHSSSFRFSHLSLCFEWLPLRGKEKDDQCVDLLFSGSPQSPSISLQPTVRDGAIVNVPWALLVRGDVVVLRPGQSAPALCRNLLVRPVRTRSDPVETHCSITETRCNPMQSIATVYNHGNLTYPNLI